jgi:hypothetical protein
MLVLHNLNTLVILKLLGTVLKFWFRNKPQRKRLDVDGTIIIKCGRKKQMTEWI